MIKKETIDRILETARVEEVVGDFVQLKKRGSSMIGLCPFHNEKTPSFHVSPAKGIYKCFGCGKGGDSVRFIMDHEKYSYPEALKYVANKYNIEVEETEVTPEFKEEQDRRESLYIVSNYAAKFFETQMWTSDEGKTIGLSYFKERGFREDIIKKFELGYSPDDWTALLDSAVSEGYQQSFLEDVGLVVKNDQGRVYDRFRGRVMFPIHNFTGRIIGFGGRTLKTDKAVPKYVNSPESDIYHKSNVLYGLFQAKKAIRDLDNCYLVEGYADVLSVYQAGVENVVASSGTSLTDEQIAIFSRLCKKITVLYDGDSAGVKAAVRGLSLLYNKFLKNDLITLDNKSVIKESFDIRIVLFPEGNDPDSYIQKFGASAFKDFISKNEKELVEFYLTTVERKDLDDPIKKIKISDEVAEILSNHPDPEFRSVYIKKAAYSLNLDERSFLNLVNSKVRGLQKRLTVNEDIVLEEQKVLEEKRLLDTIAPDEYQEKDIIRVLLTYGDQLVHWEEMTDTYIGPYIITNLSDVTFANPLYARVVQYYHDELENGYLPKERDFIQHPDTEIANMAISMISSPYQLSENWYNMHNITVPNETDKLKGTVMGAIFHLKKKKINAMISAKQKEIQEEKDEANVMILMKEYLELKEVEKYISNYLGAVITK
ncbi:MAG: DNA primase [Sphingobacteriales bacterium]|nr:DNA primase [Sphingobacteriales bacterium]